MGEEKKKSFLQELKVLGGLPWWLYLLCTFAVLAVAYTDTLGYGRDRVYRVCYGFPSRSTNSARSCRSGIPTLAAAS